MNNNYFECECYFDNNVEYYEVIDVIRDDSDVLVFTTSKFNDEIIPFSTILYEDIRYTITYIDRVGYDDKLIVVCEKTDTFYKDMVDSKNAGAIDIHSVIIGEKRETQGRYICESSNGGTLLVLTYESEKTKRFEWAYAEFSYEDLVYFSELDINFKSFWDRYFKIR